jgi:hypothetical protein
MVVDYRAWLEGARLHLVELQHQKDQLRAQQVELLKQEQEIDRKISGMAQTVSGLASLVPDAPPDLALMSILERICKTVVEVGITARIRTMLQAAAPRDLSAVEIRSELQATGFYLGDYANALSAIYTTLRRLVDAGDLEEIHSPDGKRFRWKLRMAPDVSMVPLVPGTARPSVSAYRRRRRAVSAGTPTGTPTLPGPSRG